MKLFEWFIRSVTFAINAGLVGFGFYILIQGVLYHSMFTQCFGLGMLIAGGVSIASVVSERTREFIYGKVD